MHVFAGHRTGKGIMSEEEVHRVMHVCHREAEVGTEGRKRNYSGVGGGNGWGR